jgi:enoyl-CoA hydratase/carnithine racemase
MTTPPTGTFTVRLDGAAARIDLNRPDEGNMLTRAMMIELQELIAHLAHQPKVHIIVIEARGSHFCKGRDGRGENVASMSAFDLRHKLYSAVLDSYTAIRNAPIPVLALVQGPAVGFGTALAASCDITIASDKAAFALPEIEHGIPPTLAISGIKGHVAAKAISWLVYSAETISATEAVSCGIASTVIPAADFADRTATIVQRLATRPRLVLETIKKYQTMAPALAPDMAAEYAGTLMALMRTAK